MPTRVPASARTSQKLEEAADALRVEIDTLGGNLVYVELLKHKETNSSEKNLVLLGPEHRYGLHSGLTGANQPNHTTKFSSAAKDVVLAPGANTEAQSLGIAPLHSLKGLLEMQNEAGLHAPFREWVRLMQTGIDGRKAYA